MLNEKTFISAFNILPYDGLYYMYGTGADTVAM